MEYPIEGFGWNQIDKFTDEKGIITVVFSKDGTKMIFKSGEQVDFAKLDEIISIQSDSFTEAIKETQSMINKEVNKC